MPSQEKVVKPLHTPAQSSIPRQTVSASTSVYCDISQSGKKNTETGKIGSGWEIMQYRWIRFNGYQKLILNLIWLKEFIVILTSSFYAWIRRYNQLIPILRFRMMHHYRLCVSLLPLTTAFIEVSCSPEFLLKLLLFHDFSLIPLQELEGNVVLGGFVKITLGNFIKKANVHFQITYFSYCYVLLRKHEYFHYRNQNKLKIT